MIRKVILASDSARRRELLEQMGVPFTAEPSNYDERLDDSRDVHSVAKELGLGKALAVAKHQPEAVVIGSDTIITFKGRQLGKQPNAATARKLQTELSGQTIEVITSVAVVCRMINLEMAQTDVAKVTFEPYDEAVVDTYIQSGDWEGVAGGVAVQSPYSPRVAYIEGHYDTVLGLATAPLATMLNTQGFRVTPAKPGCPWPLRLSTKSA